jgi:Leucine-rich repeat (LRR) protein
MPDQSLPKSRWPRIRLSVRALMILVLLLGGGLGWIERSVRIQRDAVAAIERTGAGVRYDWQYRNGIPNSKGKPWAPRWLVDLLGVDYFGSPAYVIARTQKMDDATLVAVGRLSRLERLDIATSSVTDFGLANLEALKRLRYLDLAATQVSDAGLMHLKGLASLTFLDLNATQVGDVGLLNLKGLTRLETLCLRHTIVSDAGLVHVTGMDHLKLLDLSDTMVGDAGMAHLSGLTSLQLLCLGDTRVSDAGLPHLTALPKLQELDFRCIRNTGSLELTNAGLNELKKAKPTLTIDH